MERNKEWKINFPDFTQVPQPLCEQSNSGEKTGNTFSKPHENLDLNVLSLSIIHSRQSVNKMMFDSDRKWKLFITTKLLQYIPDIREVVNDVPFLSLVVKKDLLDHSIMDHKIHFWLPNSFFIFVSVCIEMVK